MKRLPLVLFAGLALSTAALFAAPELSAPTNSTGSQDISSSAHSSVCKKKAKKKKKKKKHGKKRG
jgi:hypothetical protein